MIPQRRQLTGTATAQAAPITVSFPVRTRRGSLLVAGLYAVANNPTVTCKTDGGISFTLAAQVNQVTDGHTIFVFYLPNAGPTKSITATSSDVTSSDSLHIAEYRNVRAYSPLDKTATATGNSASPSSGTVNPSAAPELVFGFFGGSGDTAPYTAKATTGGLQYTAGITTLNGGTLSCFSEDLVVQSLAGVAALCSEGSVANWSAIVATFLPALPQYVDTKGHRQTDEETMADV